MKSSSLIRLSVAAAACMVALVVPAVASANPYIALGDSVTKLGTTYANDLYDSDYGPTGLGADEFLNRAELGAKSDSILSGKQLTTALADIGAPSDTKAVTAAVGGGDALFGACDSNFDVPAECNFRANYISILQQLQAALATDPGTEPLTVLAYYNHKNGLDTEAEFDRKLLGANDEVGLCDSGLDVGLNDVIFQEAGSLGIPVADAYPAFKKAGQDFVLPDGIHPTAEGHAAIAEAFRAPEHPVTDCKPPKTSFTKGPVKVSKRSVKFVFKSSEKGSKFQCSLDGKKFSGCKSPKTLKGLKKGKHTFRVRASDKAGNVDRTPAKRTFRIKR
ncbi:MAG: SGNH/GDSL hydrolase family protein [Solirubrobacterales bacterium]